PGYFGTWPGPGVADRLPERLRGPLIASLVRALTPAGVSGASGLPADADTTSTTVSTLRGQGITLGLSCLAPFELDTHYCCWIGERSPSTTANAHVLDACHDVSTRHGGAPTADRRRARTAIPKVTSWLLAQQDPAGCWADKWHRS